jgi:hypothetical protein
LAEELRVARAAALALSSTFSSGDAPSLHEAFLVAASSDLSPAERARYLAAADTALRDVAGAILVPEGQTVTLTARRADVPLVVENALKRPVRARLRLRSDKLEFPDGEVRDIELQPGVNRLDVSVETRATGAFPLEVALETPRGGEPLSGARMNIRSTAISGVGLVLSIGAGLFLVRSQRLVSPRHPSVAVAAPPDRR